MDKHWYLRLTKAWSCYPIRSIGSAMAHLKGAQKFLLCLHNPCCGRVLPCLFTLLPNKNQQTNQFFFREVLILGPGILQVIVFDFEQAAMNTMQLLSLNMEIRDCFMSHQTFDIGNIATLLYSKKGERWGVFFERWLTEISWELFSCKWCSARFS